MTENVGGLSHVLALHLLIVVAMFDSAPTAFLKQNYEF